MTTQSYRLAVDRSIDDGWRSPKDAYVDGILRAPATVVLETAVPVSTAVARLAAFLADRPRIEPATTGGESDRRLIGHVDGNQVRLAVWDSNVLSRRKSWNIEFNGAFDSGPAGAVLNGAIDIPDRMQLRALMWMFQIASALTPIIAIGLALRDSWLGRPVALLPSVAAIVLAVVAVLVTRQLELAGGRHAENDAQVLTAAVEGVLRE